MEEIVFNFSVPIQIRMSDLDPFNHVNNGVQCSYFDYGRSAYIEAILGEKIDWLAIDLVLAHISLDFIAPVLSGDQIVCDSKVVHFGNKSFKMVQQLREVTTNTIKTRSNSVIVGLDRELLTAIPIRQIYKDKFKAFENQYDKNI